MTTQAYEKRRNLIEFGAIVQREKDGGNGHVADFAAVMVDLATEYHRFAENACNYELSQRQQTRWLNVANKLANLASEYGFKVRTSNDPRGVCVKLVCKSGFTNDWGNTGIVVPIA